ncbi:CRISPR-associated protein, Csh2 family [Thermodesulfobium narugense DSM 14796]|uniref:CRISPR-associated protein, Csh2 family n=1 Tax=Thermodesulfobium narugense DSM 14796 TaxID=747365 RepID=M1E8F6_9BACT|nr:type I-B CRISPR-associated protein Cas7/Csh2 [Thermodesulfobium narugense]AEE14449.1 CRISPR-associated protein, Csh2 family [Thermodesulfobium narugense DSM 14796]
MSELLKNRSEILFLYDVKDANPNGDPMDENKPRIDEETGINIVTDVRLKRTIRDYLADYKNCDIFIKRIEDENGKPKTKEERLEEYGTDPIVDRCIDIKLFGSTAAIKSKSVVKTGPVQFKFGRSLHKVDLTYIKGTTVMPSEKGKAQGTFTEKYILPYSLIAFYGIVNENIAKIQNIKLTDSDVDLMLEGMWNGTKNLISASKFGHMPRFLFQVIYKENEIFHIGELDKLIHLKSEINEEEIRDISDVKIDVTDLFVNLNKNKDKIEKIRFKTDDRVKVVFNNEESTIDKVFQGFPKENFSFLE